MDKINLKELYQEHPVLKKMSLGEEVIWINPAKKPFDEFRCELGAADIADAAARLQRFAPFIAKAFPETKKSGGIIESPLREIARMKAELLQSYGSRISGKLLLKMDSHMPIAGSVKARGGIYEVLKHTEELALAHGLLKPGEDYAKLAEPANKKFFKDYTIQVGSTGNLGLSIGIMSAVIGYTVIIHMSADARQWKKDLLRSYGVTVKEYESDYGEAVKQGRELSDENPASYFVDDENSRDLFLGYAVAAQRLKTQLDEMKLTVDEKHPLFVYIPCGIGGAPGGISFGLKQQFKDAVHCFFVEPVQAPCMAAGMISGLQSGICVQDIGLSGKTHADGLAVSRPSGFVGKVMEPLLSGEFTVSDSRLYDYLRQLWQSEQIFLEPSTCAAFQGPALIENSVEGKQYIAADNLNNIMDNALHIVWATGGSMVPEDIRQKYFQTHL